VTGSPDPPRTEPRRSGLLVPVPEAEPLVGALRSRHDPVANLGIPTHVTVLFPFVPAADLDAGVHAALRDLFGPMAPIAYRFARVGRFGETTVYLEPDPAEAFSALTRAVVARWPEHPPYEGAFEIVVPHLTVGDQLAAEAADALEHDARRSLEDHGPVAGRCDAVILMVEGEDARWSTVGRYPLLGEGADG